MSGWLNYIYRSNKLQKSYCYFNNWISWSHNWKTNLESTIKALRFYCVWLREPNYISYIYKTPFLTQICKHHLGSGSQLNSFLPMNHNQKKKVYVTGISWTIALMTHKPEKSRSVSHNCFGSAVLTTTTKRSRCHFFSRKLTVFN